MRNILYFIFYRVCFIFNLYTPTSKLSCSFLFAYKHRTASHLLSSLTALSLGESIINWRDNICNDITFSTALHIYSADLN